jgi:hypothetical protein
MADLDHDAMLALSKELKRPLYTLEITHRDPFTAGQPARRAAAEWFAELWNRFDIQPGAHLRRIHYVLISQESGSVTMLDGSPYLNVYRPCFDELNAASLDARYLGLIDPEWLVDRRNAEPMIYLAGDAVDAELSFGGGLPDYELVAFEVPRLELTPPTIGQGYHIEFWCEKSTMNDELMPLGERYGINVVTGIGEMSLTRCVELVARAEESQRPVRILYLSDFDPAGASMPVAVARKIEFAIGDRYGLDIQVRPIVLTHEQCIRYRLPRTPIKETEKRAAKFEERFGEGATELDALEALHPGELERILLREVGRYHDPDLDNRISDVAGEVEAELDGINTKVRKRHAKALAALEAERKKLDASIRAFENKAKPVLRRIEKDLDAEAPDVDAYDWPEPDDGDEDDDPLFDSTRDFIEQTDRYKEHQGKPTESTRKPYDFFTANCASCGEEFEATSRNELMACSNNCREKLRRLRDAPPPIPCVVCGALFKSLRGATTCSARCYDKLRYGGKHTPMAQREPEAMHGAGIAGTRRERGAARQRARFRTCMVCRKKRELAEGEQICGDCQWLREYRKGLKKRKLPKGSVWAASGGLPSLGKRRP